jgi:hypothetical protein
LFKGLKEVVDSDGEEEKKVVTTESKTTGKEKAGKTGKSPARKGFGNHNTSLSDKQSKPNTAN